jgi:Cu+-exporting ATPase
MEKVWDVVCGMQAEEGKWKSQSVYKEKTYHFCCDGCKGAFERSPEYHLENFTEDHPGIEPGKPVQK